MNELEKKFNADLENYLVEEGFPNPRRTAQWAFQWVSHQQQWVSVKERLPEYGNWCLLFSWRGIVIGSYFRDRYYVMQINAPGIQMEIDSVTHWMPLLEPPK